MLKRFIDKVRRNHGLEHATITLMLANQGPMRVVGRSDHSGFWVYARIETDRLKGYVDEALSRLKGGEAHLAISPLCGTNIAMAGILAGAGSFLAITTSDRRDGLPRAIVASLLGVIASQPVGRLVQKYATTSGEAAGLSVLSVERVSPNVHKVRTAQF
ncbi:MAG TPA: DUF6391 domain-containing protein [Dehalococcoidia bacterium]|nr:DUF6391 domain-containing protein [Dehalococcoidia bacterium]